MFAVCENGLTPPAEVMPNLVVASFFKSEIERLLASIEFVLWAVTPGKKPMLVSFGAWNFVKDYS